MVSHVSVEASVYVYSLLCLIRKLVTSPPHDADLSQLTPIRRVTKPI